MLKNPIRSTDHMNGKIDAPLQLVEYGDFECSYCAKAYPIIENVKNYFGDELCLVFRHFPLTEIHPYAEMAAESAEFAASQGKFWEMHHLLYENQNRLSQDLLLQLVSSLGLSLEEYDEAMATRTYLSRVRGDFMTGVRNGVNGTPCFFINGHRHNGSYDYEELVAAIEQFRSGEKRYVTK